MYLIDFPQQRQVYLNLLLLTDELGAANELLADAIQPIVLPQVVDVDLRLGPPVLEQGCPLGQAHSYLVFQSRRRGHFRYLLPRERLQRSPGGLVLPPLLPRLHPCSITFCGDL